MKLHLKQTALLMSTALVLFLPVSAGADPTQPAHNCSQPAKPPINNAQEALAFDQEVKKYGECIDAFLKQQNAEIKNHQQGAEAAVKEWNDFITTESK